MSALTGTHGHISRQSTSYRQGLVLGLTMAEVMILLVFCLLIALAAFLKVEYSKRTAAEEQLHEAQAQLEQEREAGILNRDFALSVKNDPRLMDLLNSRPAPTDQAKIEEFWRELVEGRSVITAARLHGLTSGDLRSRMADVKAIKERAIDWKKVDRDAAITASVDRSIAPPGSATPDKVAQLIKLGLIEPATPTPIVASTGHKWPPIIALNDARGRFFKSGSAEVDPEFRQVLIEKTAPRIAELIKEYDVDVIEVVGHTDEQPVGKRQSNLDGNLVSILNNSFAIGEIKPSDNAGLGLARAVSIVAILRHSKEVQGFKILPLSGGQLINTDETLALGGNPGDVRERRRIEIRLRKSTPQDTVPQQQSDIQKTSVSSAVRPIPTDKAVQPWVPFQNGPFQIIPPSLLPPSLFVQPQ